jgi:hypothetical protein
MGASNSRAARKTVNRQSSGPCYGLIPAIRSRYNATHVANAVIESTGIVTANAYA